MSCTTRQDSPQPTTSDTQDSNDSRLYRPLALDRQGLCVRILRICPGQWADPIRCDLVVRQLSGTTRFEAVSYTWGTQWKSHTVTINGLAIRVTANLESALRHLRLTRRQRRVWVDAICINQVDLRERGAQVAQMGQIYRNAEQVFVWLGEGNGCTDLAFRYMRWSLESTDGSFSGLGRDCCPLHWHDKRKNWYIARGFHCPACQQICWCEVCYKVQTDIRAGLRDIMSRPWWSRIWVVQEVAMAAGDPIVACGDSRIPWSYLLRAQFEHQWSLTCIDQIRLDIKKPHRLRDVAGPLVYSAEAAAAGDVMKWLRETARFQASDPRDKIYALLGMARGRRWRELLPDYSISVDGLIRRLVSDLINDKDLDILTLCQPRLESDKVMSWVPDFKIEGLPYLATLKALADTSPLWQILRRLPSMTDTISISKNGGDGSLASGRDSGVILEVSGFRLDVVGRGSGTRALLTRFKVPTKSAYMDRKEFLALEKCCIRTLYYWYPVWSALHLAGVTDENGDDAAAFMNGLTGFLEREQAVDTMLDLKYADDYLERIRSLPQEQMTAEEQREMDSKRESAERIVRNSFRGMDETTVKERREALWRDIRTLEEELRRRKATLRLDFWSKRISTAMKGRRHFFSNKGLLGIGPRGVRRGDLVVLLAGSSAAFVLRRVSGLYRLVGNAFVDAARTSVPWSENLPEPASWRPEDAELEEYRIW